MESLKKYYNKFTSYVTGYSLLCKNEHNNAPESSKTDAEAAIANPADNLPSANKNNYSAIITTTRNLLIIVYLLFVFYYIYTMLVPINSNFSLEEFVEPCNDTNITTTFDELKDMKAKLDKIEYAKNSVKFVVAEYNISKYANEYLAEKYANFTNVYDDLKQQFNDEKEIYFKCYKENLLNYCNWQKVLLFLILNVLNLFVIIANFIFKEKMYSIFKLKEYELFRQELLADYDQFKNAEKQLKTNGEQLIAKYKSLLITEDREKMLEITTQFYAEREKLYANLSQSSITLKEIQAKVNQYEAKKEKLKLCFEAFAAERTVMMVYYIFYIMCLLVFCVAAYWKLSESQIEKFLI